ncbi:MAG: hypothetical protein IJ343_04615 [Clostridia bacterium]|nr:hypothetical protein [Clostridia bacterium]
MKRRIISLMLALTLVLTAIPASAQSLFGNLIKSRPVTEKAPSYAVLMETTPASETTLDDGSLQHLFRGVTMENFDAFGVYLGEKGYALANAEYVGETALQTDVVKESISFHVLYSWADEKLTVTYPKGLEVEQPKIPDPFEGYTRIEIGEPITIRDEDGKKYGELTVCGFHWNENTPEKDEKGKVTDYIDAWAEFSFKSAYPSDVFLGSVSNATVELHPAVNYVNQDNVYTYETWNIYFEHVHKNGYLKVKERLYSERVCVSSFETESFVEIYKWIPDEVLKATDGILAYTFTVTGYDKPFVFYHRNPNE